MPLYDYKCVKCSHITESFQHSIVLEIECEKCKETARREFPTPCKPKEGLTIADRKVRDQIKKDPNPKYKMFDNGKMRW